MKKKLTIALVATTADTLNSFMLAHVKQLSTKYKILIYCNNALSLKKLVPKSVILKNINFRRKPHLIIDFLTFLILLFFFLKNRPNLTISLSPKAGFLTAISSFIARVSFRIHWFTGQVWVTKKGFFYIFYKFLDKIISNLSHHILVDSYSQMKFLVSKSIISKNKSSVLLNGSVGGVNLKKFKFKKKSRDGLRRKFHISKNDFIFLYLGRINKDKGVIDLIEAFKGLQESYKMFLILAGPMEDNYIKEQINKNNKIYYIGKTLSPEKWYSMADILCLPSYREGFGSVVIEAGSCNLPSLGSNIYGISDSIVQNQTGILHKVGNIIDIKKKMLFAINNKKLLKKYGLNARKRVERKFEERLICKKFFEFINQKLD